MYEKSSKCGSSGLGEAAIDYSESIAAKGAYYFF